MTQITIELDDAREIMYDKLVERFSEEGVEEALEEQVKLHLTQMFDNREKLEEEA